MLCVFFLMSFGDIYELFFDNYVVLVVFNIGY